MKKFYSKNTFFCLPKIQDLLILFLLTLVSYSSFGQILQRGTTTTDVTNNGSLSINRPTGVTTGDVLILNVAQRGNNTLSNPTASGWTLVTSADLGTVSGTYRRATVYYKIAGSSEPNNYGVTPDSDHNGSVGSIIAFSGVDVTSGPFDVTPGSINTSNSNTATASSITTVSANAAIIMLTQAIGSDPYYSNWSTSSPGSLTELYDEGINNRVSIGAAWEIKSGIGSTGIGTNSLTNSERNGAILLALKPICPTRPGTPGTMTGPSAPCAGSTGIVYSVPTLTNAATYEWTVPSGWTITSGLNTNSITVTVGSSGNIAVVGVSSCNEKSYTPSQMNIGVVPLPSVPGSSSPYTFTCNGFTAQWGPHYLSTSYYIDVATNSSFSAGTILSSYDNLNVGNVQFLVLSGLSSGTTYYYRVRASNACGTSGNSGTMSGTTTGPTVGMTSSNQSVCSGNSPSDITLTGSTGTVQWQSSTDNSSFSNISGASSSILTSAQMGVLTATRYYRAMLTNSGCTSYSTVVTVTVTASTLSTTGPTICVGGSGTLTASGVCGSVFTNSGTAFSGAWTGTSDPTAFRPTNITNSATCSFSTTTRNYVATVFQVSVTGNYTFSMDQNGNYDGMGYITTGAFVPGNCSGGGAWIIGDDDSNGNFEPRMNAIFTAGVTYTLISTTYYTSNISDSFSWTVTPPVGGQILLETSPTIQWYTSSTGGTAIGSGTPFNPVGVAGSGLANTNTVGTTIFYAACSTNPGCRTATSFTINANPTIAAITAPAALCSGGSLNPTAPTVTTNGSAVTASGWQLETGVGTGTFANLTVPYVVAFADNGKKIRYYATNGCGTTNSNQVVITVNNVPTIVAIASPAALCSGGSLNPTAPTVAANGSAVTASGWQLEMGVGSGTFANLTVPYVVAFADNGKKIRYYATNGCGTIYSNQVDITVNSVISGNTVASNQTVCSGASPAPLIGSTPTGGNGTYTYLWQSSTTSSTAGFTTATGTNNTINYSPGPLTTSTWYRRITTSGTCVNTTTAIAVTVATAATPTIGTITQPTCTTPTGTVVLSSLPSSGTWTISRSGSSSASFTGTGTSTTISGLAAGSYTFTVTLASCTSAATANVPINALVTTSYNGSSWSVAPTANTRGVITNSGTIATNVDLCSCTVNTGVTAIIADGVMMRLQNELVVTGTGSITFNKNSSLVQINATAANSGSIFYERETTPITNFDYTYWSSPVAGQKLIDFSPNTLGDKFLSFNSFSNSWNYEDAYNNLMGKGVGYIIRGPQTKSGQPPSTQLYRFTGAPNNGLVSLPIGAAGNSVLIGNPYPSALDADKFLDANASLIEGTIYFWTHNTSLRLASSLAAGTAGSGSYAYTSDDYAAYNRTGGVATYAAPSASNPSPSSPIVSGNAPTSNIGAGQSFFGTSLATGSVQFTNNMRVGFTGLASNSNSQFFKTTSSKKTVGTIDKNRIWIDLTNEEGAFKETLLGYITGASNAFETAFDGESYDANAFVDFYSINEDKKLTIQGRALPFDDSEIIPLGYKANIGGQFNITIRDKDGLFTTQNVYLEDKLLGTVIDLSEGTYKFTTEIGVFNDRFAIRYTNKTLGVEVFDPVAEGVYISNKNKVITVQVGTETIVAAYVYDLAGKQLFAKKAVDSNQMSISNLSAANVVLVVKVVLNNGSVVTQKIVY